MLVSGPYQKTHFFIHQSCNIMCGWIRIPEQRVFLIPLSLSFDTMTLANWNLRINEFIDCVRIFFRMVSHNWSWQCWFIGMSAKADSELNDRLFDSSSNSVICFSFFPSFEAVNRIGHLLEWQCNRISIDNRNVHFGTFFRTISETKNQFQFLNGEWNAYAEIDAPYHVCCCSSAAFAVVYAVLVRQCWVAAIERW